MPDYVNMLASFATVAAAVFAYLAIRQNAINQRDLLVQSLHDKFFDINRDLNNRTKSRQKLTEQDYELLANLSERIAQVVKYKHVQLVEFKSFKELFLSSDFINFIDEYRKNNGNSFYEDTVWLQGEYKLKRDAF